MIDCTRTRRFVCVFFVTDRTTGHFDLFQRRILAEGELTGGTGALTGHISEKSKGDAQVRDRKRPQGHWRAKATERPG
jgi:hypothetical protein